MEKLSGGCHKKNFKNLITILTIVGVVIVFCFMGILFCYNPILTTYKVEYINGKNDILVQTYSKGEKLYLPDNPKKYGYNFIGWSFDKEENNLVDSELVVDKELTLYAKWEEKIFNLSYNGLIYKIDYSCAFDVTNESLSFIDNENTLVKIDKIEKEGYEFLGWELYDESFSTSNFELLDLDKFNSLNLTLEAKYLAKQAQFKILDDDNFDIDNLSHNDSISIGETLSFDIVLESSVSDSKISIVSTCGVVKKIKENNVYKVQISDFTDNFEVSITNIYINEYEITFVNGEEAIVDYYKYSELVQLPKFEKVGYKLVGFKDSEGNLFVESFSAECDLYLEAIFEIKQFTVEFPKNNGKYLIKYNDEFLVNTTITKNYFDSLEFISPTTRF